MARFLEKLKLVTTLATYNISIFLLVSVDEETCLSLTSLETYKTGFLATKPILKPFNIRVKRLPCRKWYILS